MTVFDKSSSFKANFMGVNTINHFVLHERLLDRNQSIVFQGQSGDYDSSAYKITMQLSR
jgi:hypothetical protein